jgi:hypothetical protein
MRRFRPLLIALLLVGAPTSYGAELRLVDGVSGAPTNWSDWVGKRGPVAVLVWASWTPGAEAALAGYRELEVACQEKGLHLVVLDVQETLEDGREALTRHEAGWLHDRHGALLKEYRVISVPSLLLVAADGSALAKIAATPEAVRSWGGP